MRGPILTGSALDAFLYVGMDVNETQNPSPRPPSSSRSAQTRQKIVEIVAGTANGYLAQLGYAPGIPQKLKELELQNEEWKLENMKLYQDNASLLDLIHQQNERIKEIRAPDPEKVSRIMELNAELQQTRTQRDELARAHSANNSTPSQLQQNHAHLQGDYIRVINGYRIKCAEVQRLENHVQTLLERLSSMTQSQGPEPQTQYRSQHQSQPQSQPQSRPQGQPHPQHQLQFPQHSRPPVQQHLPHQFSQQQPQSHGRLQIQQHLQPSSQHHPQPVTAQRSQSNQPPQGQLTQPHVQNHVQQQHPYSVSAISGPQQTPYPLSQTQKVQRNTQSPVFGQMSKQKYPLRQTQQAILEQRYQPVLHSQQPRSRQSSGSMHGTSTRESSVDIANPQQHSPLLLDGLSSLSRSNPYRGGLRAAQSISPTAPTMPQPFATRSRTSLSNSSGPPTPAISPLNQQFLAPSSSNFNLDSLKTASPPANMVSSTPILNTSVPQTIAPQDTYLRLNQVPSSQMKHVQSSNGDTSSAGTSTSPVTSSVAFQPMNPAIGLPASIPPQQMNSLKRESPAGSEDHHELTKHLQKRPRLEASPLHSTITNTPIESVANGTENNVQTLHIDDEDEVIEVGPDGLRLLEDCIFDLFGDEENNGEGRFCKLCIARRTMGYRTHSPKPFVNATNNELQEHCMTEHAEAWDTLRQTV